MTVLTEDMKRVVHDQVLGFWATVCPDGSPNLSPKGTTRVWDDEHLFCAEVCSPNTVANIRRGSLVEVNVVDPFVRKGYRFKGPAVVHERGTAAYAHGLDLLRADGSTLTAERVNAIVVIEVREALLLISPAYDNGTTTELELLHHYQTRYAQIHARLEHQDSSSPPRPATTRRRKWETSNTHNAGSNVRMWLVRTGCAT